VFLARRNVVALIPETRPGMIEHKEMPINDDCTRESNSQF
jgi:hypothetical protein